MATNDDYEPMPRERQHARTYMGRGCGAHGQREAFDMTAAPDLD
jgi:hypothetical protein